MLPPPVVDPSLIAEPERALASGIPAIRALGNAGMFSPTLVPEEILIDHPERIRAVIVEGSNPLLSYSDSQRWREARERLDLLVVIDPAMTETAELADYVLPTPCGYEKWEFTIFPKRYPEIHTQVRPPARAAAGRSAAGAGDLRAPRRGDGPVRRPVPAELHELAAHALEPDGAAAYMMARRRRPRSGDETPAHLLELPRARPAPARAVARRHLAAVRPERALPLRVGAAHARPRVGGTRAVRDRDRALPPHPRPPRGRGGRAAAPRDQPRRPRDVPGRPRAARARADARRDAPRASTRRRRSTPSFRSCSPPGCARAGPPTRSSATRAGGRDAGRTARSICRRPMPRGSASANGDAVVVSTRRGAVTLPAQVDPKLLRRATSGCRTASACEFPGNRGAGRRQPERADGRRGPRPVHRHPAPPRRALPDRARVASSPDPRSTVDRHRSSPTTAPPSTSHDELTRKRSQQHRARRRQSAVRHVDDRRAPELHVTTAMSASEATFTPSRNAPATGERRSRGTSGPLSATNTNAGRKMPTVATRAPRSPPRR